MCPLWSNMEFRWKNRRWMQITVKWINKKIIKFVRWKYSMAIFDVIDYFFSGGFRFSPRLVLLRAMRVWFDETHVPTKSPKIFIVKHEHFTRFLIGVAYIFTVVWSGSCYARHSVFFFPIFRNSFYRTALCEWATEWDNWQCVSNRLQHSSPIMFTVTE